MSRSPFVCALILSFLGIALASGCGQQAPSAGPDYKLHDSNAFSSDELNAPLNAKAKAKGAQVAAPPIR